MEPRRISVKGAREHNLRDVSLDLPRGKLICFTGVSGSGKSSFAFDTLFAEGQRRYLESLSSYARQFLGQIAKPDVDQISGLSPAIAIQQKTSGWNPRSTVGTITQIQDYLRVLYARVGRQHCTECGRPISAQSREQIIARILELPEKTRVMILAPVVRGQKGEYRDLFEDMIRRGYARARVDGEVAQLSDPPKLARNIRHHIEIVIDRLVISPTVRPRLAEAVEQALKLGDGTLIVQRVADRAAGFSPRDESDDAKNRAAGFSPRDDSGSVKTNATPKRRRSTKRTRPSSSDHDLLLSSHYACTRCDVSFEPPSPQLFSFNSPTGMCLTCDGLGTAYDFDVDLLVPDPKKSFLNLAIAPMRTRIGKWRRHIFRGVAAHVGFDLKTPWRKLPEKAKRALLFGTGDAHITYEWRWSGGVWRHGGTFEGVIATLRDNHRKAKSGFVRAYYEKYMRQRVCPDCSGSRLNRQALAVRIGGLTLSELCHLSIEDAAKFFGAPLTEPQASACATIPNRPEPRASARANIRTQQTTRSIGKRGVPGKPATSSTAPAAASDRLRFSPTESIIATEVLKEIRGRLRFLLDVGLGYLSLDRSAPTLSGGESQRIRLASQIGAGLVGVLYILDEPSIGLHPRDNQRLLDSLCRLRDLGNTVIVVEHDEQTMRAADEIVDFGPGPGVRGGEVVARGSLERIKKSRRSVTGKYLRGAEEIAVPKERRPVKARGARR